MPITRRKTLASAAALLGPTVLSGVATAEHDLAKVAQADELHDMPDLKTASPNAHIREIRYAGGGYVVKTANGNTLSFGERDIRFKTDASLKGPLSGQPVLVPSGKRGDRVCIVFAAPT